MSTVAPHYPRPLKNPRCFHLPPNLYAPSEEVTYPGLYSPATLLATIDGWDVWSPPDTPHHFFMVRLSDLLVEFDYCSCGDGRTDVHGDRRRTEVPQSVRDFLFAYTRLTLS